MIIIESSPIMGRITGIGKYTQYLIKALNSSQKKQKLRLIDFSFLYLNAKKPNGFKDYCFYFCPYMAGRVFYKLERMGIDIPYQLFFPFFSKKNIWIFPNFKVPKIFFNKNIMVVIYDLGYIFCPDVVFSNEREFFNKKVPYSINRSQTVITISHRVKNEIVSIFGIKEEKIIVAECGVDHSVYYPRIASNDIKNKYNLPDRYIHYHGTLEPRKNIINILKGYEALDLKYRNRFGLVLSGGKGWYDEEIRATIGRMQNDGLNIIITSYVEEEDLPYIYSMSDLFIFPSLYEGFGMPIVEAMACGKAVITSNCSSMPEVVGATKVNKLCKDILLPDYECGLNGAAYLVRPNEYKDISKAIEAVLGDDKLRNKMIQLSISRASHYSWERGMESLVQRVSKMV